MTRVLARPPIAAAPLLPPMAGLMFAAALTLALWDMRARSRRALAALPAERLDDLGLTRADARAEAAKPFWRA